MFGFGSSTKQLVRPEPSISPILPSDVSFVIGPDNFWLESLTFQMTNMSYAEQGEKLAGPLALLKLLATKAATHIADESCQIFGGRALTSSGMGKLVERYWRAVKFGAILGGSEEIMADLGVRQALRTWPAEAKL